MPRVLLIAALLLLAGCVGKSPAAPLSPAAVSQAGPTPASASSEDPSSQPAANATTPAPRIVKLEGDSSFAASEGDPVMGGSALDLTRVPFEIKEAKPTKATLVATWPAATPAGQSLQLFLMTEGGKTQASAQGPSPLMLQVPANLVAAPGKLWGLIEAASPGVAVNEQAHLVLTLQYG